MYMYVYNRPKIFKFQLTKVCDFLILNQVSVFRKPLIDWELNLEEHLIRLDVASQNQWHRMMISYFEDFSL